MRTRVDAKGRLHPFHAGQGKISDSNVFFLQVLKFCVFMGDAIQIGLEYVIWEERPFPPGGGSFYAIEPAEATLPKGNPRGSAPFLFRGSRAARFFMVFVYR